MKLLLPFVLGPALSIFLLTLSGCAQGDSEGESARLVAGVEDTSTAVSPTMLTDSIVAELSFEIDLSRADTSLEAVELLPSDSTSVHQYEVQPATPPAQPLRIFRANVGAPLNTELVIVIMDSVFLELAPRIVGVTPSSSSGTSALGVLRRQNAKAVVGSGFVETFHPPSPVGLLIVDGEIVNPLNPRGLSTIIFVKGGRLQLSLKDTFDPSGVEGAIQVGPMLLQNGGIIISANEPQSIPAANRAFVGLHCDGNVAVGITMSPVSLYHLASFLKRELGCANAVNLAGGGSEVLAFHAADSTEGFGSVNQRHASMIAFLESH